MKQLTLTQPWATLVASGAKRIETRSWRTDYRGPIAIHAAAGLNGLGQGAGQIELDYLCSCKPFAAALAGVPRPLPRGMIVAVAELDLVTSTVYADETLADSDLAAPDERAFGNYDAGRFMWLLSNVRPLPLPVRARGMQALVDVDRATSRLIRQQLENEVPA